MGWIKIVWPMIAGACLTLALIHLVVWFKQRSHYDWLAFAVRDSNSAEHRALG